MKALTCILFISLNFLNLFIFQPRILPIKILKYLFMILGSLILCAMLISVFINTSNEIRLNTFFLIYASFVIITIISIANKLSHMMVDYLVHFHQKYNEANLNRGLVKFLIQNKGNLKRTFTIIWFLGSLIMLLGVWKK